MRVSDLPSGLVTRLRHGVVIPAMPLALTSERRLDIQRQKALTRYYIDAGAGGIAVGVHTTQFAIRDPGIELLKPVLSCISEAVDEWSAKRKLNVIKIAGVCGRTSQALEEAQFASDQGYHACLLSLSSFQHDEYPVLLQHCRQIAQILPLVGFYLQPAVGGRMLSHPFWRAFVEIENVLAIKIAPFNRYQTLDVVRAVVESGRTREIALYTGNDDSILIDLLTPYSIETPNGPVQVRIVGGLLGQWAVWTRKAVEILENVQTLVKEAGPIPPEWLTRAAQLTEANGAVFNAKNNFAGCIPGIHYVLQKQGLLAGTWCLNPNEILSPGQAGEIERVWLANPWFVDDLFVHSHLQEWLEAP